MFAGRRVAPSCDPVIRVDKKGVDLDKGLIGSEPPVIDQPQIPFQPPR